MRRTALLLLLCGLTLVGQIVQMGTTTLSSNNVRYANAGVTGTTLNKLAKLTGAPSTAVITATTDTSGIVGIVVLGAGTTGSADIAYKGKASCVFDGATTAGHYVINSNTVAGDCKDGGATYPTSGQVIGVVTSTNGGGGTYEVDLTLGQPQAGGGAGGATIGSGTYATKPATCNIGDAYLPTDSMYQILRCNPANTWNHYINGKLLTPPVLADFTWVNQETATAVNTYGGIYMSTPAVANDHVRILEKAVPGSTPWTVTAAFIFNAEGVNYHFGGLLLRQSSDGKFVNLVMSHNSSWAVELDKYTDPVTFNSQYVRVPMDSLPYLYWLQITDDGANRIARISFDGTTYHQIFSVGRTDFMTGNQFGIQVSSSNATYGADLWCVHWVVN